MHKLFAKAPYGARVIVIDPQGLSLLGRDIRSSTFPIFRDKGDSSHHSVLELFSVFLFLFCFVVGQI